MPRQKGKKGTNSTSKSRKIGDALRPTDLPSGNRMRRSEVKV